MQTDYRNRRKMGSVLTPFIVYFGINFLVSIFAVTAILMPQITQYAQMEDSLAAQTELYQEIMMETVKMGTLLTTVGALLMIPVFLWLFFKDRKFEQSLNIAAGEKARLWKYLLIVPLAGAVGLGSNNIVTLFNLPAISESYQQAAESLYAGPFWLQLLGLAFLVPVSEELMFRGLIYKRLKLTMDGKKSMILSSVIFGVFHGNIVQGLFGFGLGLLFCFLYEKYGSLKAAVLGHMTANLVSVLATEFDFLLWMFQSPLRVGIITVICAALSATIIVWLMNDGKAAEEA